jgi:hypothetical protein
VAFLGLIFKLFKNGTLRHKDFSGANL